MQERRLMKGGTVSAALMAVRAAQGRDARADRYAPTCDPAACCGRHTKGAA